MANRVLIWLLIGIMLLWSAGIWIYHWGWMQGFDTCSKIWRGKRDDNGK